MRLNQNPTISSLSTFESDDDKLLICWEDAIANVKVQFAQFGQLSLLKLRNTVCPVKK